MKVTMYPAISLDGFIARPTGDTSWISAEDYERYEQAVRHYRCMIVGGTTFREAPDEYRSRKEVTSFVYTNHPGSEEENIKFIHGAPQEMLRHLEAQGFSEVIVCGGGEVNGLFASAGLVDEMVVSIQPVVLGEGIPLFGSYKPSLKLELLSTNEDIKGVTQNHYKVLKDAEGAA